MRHFFFIFLTGWAVAAHAAPLQLHLDVAHFRNEDRAVKGSVVDINATVAGQGLTYRQRAPKSFQAAAVLTLEVLKADGRPAYQETVTLKPPALSDTTAALKNPVSFQKRLVLPDGRYTVRGRLRDQYQTGAAETVAEQPLVLESGAAKPYLSDVVLLARPASKSSATGSFIRNGYQLTRAPGGYYPRGTDQVFFYAELYQAPQGQPLHVRYRIQSEEGAGAAAEVELDQAAAGQPTVIEGGLPLGPLPSGQYTFTMEVLDAKNQVLATQSTAMRRDFEDYAPTNIVAPR